MSFQTYAAAIAELKDPYRDKSKCLLPSQKNSKRSTSRPSQSKAFTKVDRWLWASSSDVEYFAIASAITPGERCDGLQ